MAIPISKEDPGFFRVTTLLSALELRVTILLFLISAKSILKDDSREYIVCSCHILYHILLLVISSSIYTKKTKRKSGLHTSRDCPVQNNNSLGISTNSFKMTNIHIHFQNFQSRRTSVTLGLYQIATLRIVECRLV